MPSRPANTALPAMLPRRSARNRAEGFGDLGEAAIGHLEDADLVGGAEAVLDGAQDAELVAALAFEIEHGVDHVLQHARAGEAAVLGDVADQDQGEAAGFGQADQLEPGGADLGDGAGGAVDACRATWSGSSRSPPSWRGVCSSAAAMSRRLTAAARPICASTDAEAAGAEADLVDGLFAGDVEDAAAGAGEAGGGLEQEGGLADAGVAADQDGGGGDEAAAEHAIQFRDGGGSAGRRLGFAGQADEGDASAGRGFARRGRGAGFPRRWCSTRRRIRSGRTIWM